MNRVPFIRWSQIAAGYNQVSYVDPGLPPLAEQPGDYEVADLQFITCGRTNMNLEVCDKSIPFTGDRTRGPSNNDADPPNVILLAEDKQQNWEITDQLQQLDCRVLQTDEPQRVLASEHESELDLLIIQQAVIPDDCPSFLTQVRQRPSLQSVYVILLLADSDPDTQSKELDAGVDVCVEETEELDLLLAYVRVGLRVRRQYRKMHQTVADQTLSTLAVTLAHEINNPLTGILGYLTFLAEEISRLELPKLEEMLVAVRTQALRIQALIQDLNRLRAPRTTTYVNGVQMFELTGSDDSQSQD